MWRIDVPSAVSVMPTPASAGATGFFFGGNPASSTPATIADPDWFNRVQEELMSVVVAGGVTPSKTAYNQMLTAIQALITANAVPAGLPAFWYGSSAPSGWLPRFGQVVARTTYPNLWAFAQASGNLAASDGVWTAGQFSPGDGATTFRLPDMRGRFERAIDNGLGVDPGRGIFTIQLDAGQGHVHGPSGTGIAFAGDTSPNGGRGTTSGGAFDQEAFTQTGGPISDGANGTPRTAAETRPNNIALLPIIKF